MELPNTLMCKCMNPLCGIMFSAVNPVRGNVGRNNSFYGNTTNCPQCGQTARYSDWHTDNQGNIHINDFFNYIRKFKDIGKLEVLKTNLEAANDAITADELADTLTNFDPNFRKYKNVVKIIPPSEIPNFLITTISIVTLLITILGIFLNQANHDENMKLEEAKFEYEKQQDKHNQHTQNQTEKELKDITNKIEALTLDFEAKLKKVNLENSQSIQQSKSLEWSKLKGKYRNKPCPCGSGKKAKKCHPNSYINESK